MKQFLSRFNLAIVSSLLAVSSWAQQGQLQRGGQALTEAAGQIRSNFVQPVITLAYVVALIMGIAGGVRVFKKMQDGDQDAAKSGGALVGAAIFLVVVIYIFQQFFGQTGG